jgi:hypothetical protein
MSYTLSHDPFEYLERNIRVQRPFEIQVEGSQVAMRTVGQFH